MALNNSREAMSEYRKREVARLLLRGLTQREIVEELEKAGIINPSTGRAYSLGTVNDDVQGMKAEWTQGACEDTRILRGRVLAESREVRRIAWQKEDLAMVQRGLAQETTLLGLQRLPAPEDMLHYVQVIKKVANPTCLQISELIAAGKGPDVTPEERVTAKAKFEDWANYASMLLSRNEEEEDDDQDDEEEDGPDGEGPEQEDIDDDPTEED